jgi:hypothetical protein
MPDLPTKGYENCHAQSNDGSKYASLRAEALHVANLLDPWDDAVEEAKSHDIL